MKNKVFGFALLMLIITAAGTWAQNLPSFPGSTSDVNSIWTSSIWSSPQSTTTEGRYRSNADNFIRPDQYTGVRFDKWFGMTSFLYNQSAGVIGTAGFAAKANTVYIGAFYTGNLWAGRPINNYAERVPETLPTGGVADKVYNVYGGVNVASGSVNNAAVLIGVKDMGFRLAYRTNYHSFNEDGIVIGNATTSYQLYDNYQAQLGYIAPQIAWAMAKDLIKDKGIRPYLTADLVFFRDYQKQKMTGDASGERVLRSLNHFDPSIALGLGGFTFLSKDGFRLSADLDYALTFKIYDNEYSYLDGNNKYKTGTIKGTYRQASFGYVEESYVSHLITPSLSGQWGKDKLALRFKLNAVFTINNIQSSIMGLKSNGDLLKVGNDDEYATFIFRPDLRLALQYKIIPDKLTFNAGARLQATALTVETNKRTLYNSDGNKVESSKIHQNSTGSGFVSRFSIGPTFNFTENVWVEATTGISNTYGDGAIEIFAPGGLFSFGSILVGLKF